MIDKEEAKERMKCDWKRFAKVEEVLDALLDKDQVKLDAIIAMRARVTAYNTKMKEEIDGADQSTFENMVNTFRPYQDV